MSVVLAILAAFLFAVAATFQQRGALELGISTEGLKSFVKLAGSSWWLAGTGALLVGYVAQAIALDRGRISIVQPLLVSTVVFALPLGYFVTSQVVTMRQGIGAATVVVGLAAYALFGKPASGNDYAPNDEWAICLVIVGAVCVVLMLGARGSGGGLRKAAFIGVVSGILFGLSACLTKPTLETLHDSGVAGVVESWELYGLAFAGIAAFVLQQVSLAEGFLATSVATVSVANPIVSVLIGIVLFDERLKDPAWHKLIAFAGLGLAALGAVAISKAREPERVTTEPALAAPPQPT
jgi:drug/metabolite transporter (DMT)-like permease